VSEKPMSDWRPIVSAPMDGTVIRLKCDYKPEYGEHAMRWNRHSRRWEGVVFAPLRTVRVWWDEEADQPNKWQPLPPPPAV